MSNLFKSEKNDDRFFKTEERKKKEKGNDIIIKNEISFIIDENINQYPKNINLSLIGYIYKNKYKSIKYESILEYFIKQYNSDPYSIVGSSTSKIFSTLRFLISSVKNILKRNNCFVIVKNQGNIYINLNLKNTLKYLIKIYGNNNIKNEDITAPIKIISTNSKTNNEIFLEIEEDLYLNEIEEENNNLNKKKLLQKKRTNFFNLETDDEYISFNEKVISLDTNSFLNQKSNNKKLNIYNIQLYEQILFSDEEFINYTRLNKELNKSFDLIKDYYSQISEIKEKFEYVKNEYTIMMKKRDEYIKGKKNKELLEKEEKDLYKILSEEIKSIDLFKENKLNDNNTVDNHMKEIKNNINYYNNIIEKIKNQINDLNIIKNDMLEQKEKITDGLNSIIKFYDSPNICPSYKDFITKKLNEFINRCIKINERIDNNIVHLITFNETIQDLKIKSEDINLQYQELENNKKNNSDISTSTY